MVIIGVLIAIAATIFNQATTRAETAAIEANLRTINGAIMMIMASEAQPTAGWVLLHFADAAHGTPAAGGMSNYLTGGLAAQTPGAYSVVAAGSGMSCAFVAQVVITAAGGQGPEAGSWYLCGGYFNKEYTRIITLVFI